MLSTLRLDLARRIFCSALFSVLAIGFAMPAHAGPITYDYTGVPFNLWGGTLSCSGGVGDCGISGSFVVSTPLGDNLNLAVVTPVSYSFTDGAQTLTNLNSSIENFTTTKLAFVFSTNASGQITEYYIGLLAKTGLYEFILEDLPPNAYDIVYNETSTIPITELGFASNDTGSGDHPGSWGPSVTSVPEPSDLFLVGTGVLFALAAARVKFLRR
jgi:hypothetical protein